MGKSRRFIFLIVMGMGLTAGAFVWSARAKKNHIAEVATYEMSLPTMSSEWQRKPHGPFLKDKFVSKKTGDMITLGESHGDADYVVTPDQTDVSLAEQVVHAGEANGWKTLQVGQSEPIQGARFVFVERTGGTHTYWTAVGVQGNSSYILALTMSGSDKDREAHMKSELPYFRKVIEESTFRQDPPAGLVASL